MISLTVVCSELITCHSLLGLKTMFFTLLSSFSICPSSLLSIFALRCRLALKHTGGEIPLSAVGKESDHPLAFSETRGHLERRPARGARRDAEEKPFFAREPLRHLCGLAVRHRDDLIIDPGIQDLRDKTRADPRDSMRSWLASRQDRRRGRLNSKDPYPFEFFLQHLAHAGDRASGAHARDKGVYLPRAHGGNDLLCGGFTVDLRVCGISELVRHEVTA